MENTPNPDKPKIRITKSLVRNNTQPGQAGTYLLGDFSALWIAQLQ